MAISAAVLAGLLSYQFTSNPNLERSSLEPRANAEVQKVIDESDIAKLVKSSVSFTRANVKDQNTLLCLIYVQRPDDVSISDREIRDRLTKKIQNHLLRKDFKATPLINVSVLEAPKQK